jgi:hypothetical protein
MPTKPTTYYNRPLDSTLTGTLDIDFSRDLTLDHETEVPLLTLLSKLRSEKTETSVFKFAIGRFAPRTSTVNGAVTSPGVGSSTTVNVATGTGVYFVPWDVVEFPMGTPSGVLVTQGYISAITSDALTVYPYKTTGNLQAIADGDTIRRLNSATREGDSGRNSSQTIPNVYTQYVQTFEDYFDVTRIQAENRQYTGPERTRLREEARKKHALDHEYAYFMSLVTQDTTTTGKPRQQMSGLVEQISTNVLTYGATLDQNAFFDFITSVHNPMYSGGVKRMVLCSGDLLGSINKLATPSLRITTKETTWGPMISEVQFAGKVWEFVEAPVLSEARPGWGVVIQPAYIKKRVLFPTRYEMNVQNPIDKFYKDGFYSVDAIEFRLEELGGIVKPA